MSFSFRLATYNVLHGMYPREITESLQKLVVDGASVIALQEFIRPEQATIATKLGRTWKIKYLLQNPGNHLGIGFLWDMSKVNLSNFEEVSLPQIERIDWRGRIRGVKKPVPRSALVSEALINNEHVRIITLHLDWYGGAEHRLKQLRYLLDQLKKKPSVGREIICGDFNTLTPRFMVHKEERRFEQTLGTKYQNVFPQLSWSCDTSRTDTPDMDRLAPIYQFLDKRGIHFRLRLDYMFVKGLLFDGATFYADLTGSDHRPLAANFFPAA